MTNRKQITKKTFQIGVLTQISRILGIVRELLLVKYVGVGIISDAFITAYKVPTALRKIFAEGALSASLVPSLVKLNHENPNQQPISGFMSLAFLIIEGACLAFVLLGIIYAFPIISFIAPGFNEEQMKLTASCLRILMPFILFVSSAALLSTPLQAKSFFLIPAISPALLNVIFIAGLLICLYFNLSLFIFCFFVLSAAAIISVIHYASYRYYGFSFARPTTQDWGHLKNVLIKLCICLPTISFSEINLFIDTSFASFLPKGSISLLYLANRFMGIPLGVLVGSFVTVLLPHFSKLSLTSPKKLSFFIHESLKAVIWITIPTSLLLFVFSHAVFQTLFISTTFTAEHAQQAGMILSIFGIGLIFLSINRILLNAFYAIHLTWIPAVVAFIALLNNIALNYLFLRSYGVYGLAAATTISGIIQSILYVIILEYKGIRLYLNRLAFFGFRQTALSIFIALPFVLTYSIIAQVIHKFANQMIYHFLYLKIGYWFWAGPLSLCYLLVLWYVRKTFKLHLFLVD